MAKVARRSQQTHPASQPTDDVLPDPQHCTISLSHGLTSGTILDYKLKYQQDCQDDTICPFVSCTGCRAMHAYLTNLEKQRLGFKVVLLGVLHLQAHSLRANLQSGAHDVSCFPSFARAWT